MVPVLLLIFGHMVWFRAKHLRLFVPSSGCECSNSSLFLNLVRRSSTAVAIDIRRFLLSYVHSLERKVLRLSGAFTESHSTWVWAGLYFCLKAALYFSAGFTSTLQNFPTNFSLLTLVQFRVCLGRVVRSYYAFTRRAGIRRVFFNEPLGANSVKAFLLKLFSEGLRLTIDSRRVYLCVSEQVGLLVLKSGRVRLFVRSFLS